MMKRHPLGIRQQSMKTAHWQAIIFDFDGVVVESGDIKTQAFANLYRSYGDLTIMTEVARYHKLNGGMSRYQKFHYFQTAFTGKAPSCWMKSQQLDRQLLRTGG